MFGSIGSALGVSADAAFGGTTSAIGELYKNQEAKRAAKRQMEFQAQMSNTGYQRAMQDMKAAGLNPILAGKLGPASSPGGAMYQPGNIGQAFVQGMQGASSARQQSVTASIDQRTLDMLERENVTLPEIQYTARNIFQSKALRTVEAALANDIQSAPGGVYKGIAYKIRAMAIDAGLLKGNMTSVNKMTLGQFFAQVGELFAASGIEAFKGGLDVLMESLK